MIVFREWLPSASEVYLMGDFNGWNRCDDQYRLECREYGYYEITLDRQMIKHNDRLKLQIKTKNGQYIDKIPAWIKYTIQNENDKSYDGVYTDSNYRWLNPQPSRSETGLRIYECHIGMAGIEHKVHSFIEFTNNVLPRIKNNNYNCL